MSRVFARSLCVPLALSAAFLAVNCSTIHNIGENPGSGSGGQEPMMPEPEMSNPDPEPAPVAPLVFSVTPALGSTSGGIPVRIKGGRFLRGPDLAVSFDDIPATGVRWISESELEATLPAHPGRIGPVSVRVTSSNGLATTAAGAFRYYYGRLGFGAPSLVGTTSEFQELVFTGDVDVDGKLDVVACSQSGGTSVLWGDGAGGFERSDSIAPGKRCWGATIEDIDGDKNPDVLIGSDSTLIVVKGRGRRRTFFPVESYVGRTDPIFRVLASDMTGDGLADLMLLGGDNNECSLFQGQAGGSLRSPPLVFPSGFGATFDVAAIDLNGDGKKDLVNIVAGTGVAVVLGNGDGTFLPPVYYGARTAGETWSLAVQDVNDDGRPDFLHGGYTDLSLYLNVGDGTLIHRLIPHNKRSFRLASVDFDGDGRLDLLSLNNSSPKLDLSFLRGAAGALFEVPLFVSLNLSSVSGAAFGDAWAN